MYTTLHRVARFDLALGVHAVMGRRARAGGGGITGDTLYGTQGMHKQTAKLRQYNIAIMFNYTSKIYVQLSVHSSSESVLW